MRPGAVRQRSIAREWIRAPVRTDQLRLPHRQPAALRHRHRRDAAACAPEHRPTHRRRRPSLDGQWHSRAIAQQLAVGNFQRPAGDADRRVGQHDGTADRRRPRPQTDRRVRHGAAGEIQRRRFRGPEQPGARENTVGNRHGAGKGDDTVLHLYRSERQLAAGLDAELAAAAAAAAHQPQLREGHGRRRRNRPVRLQLQQRRRRRCVRAAEVEVEAAGPAAHVTGRAIRRVTAM